tara:strand:+ start:83704 stop:84276 length:573 start_codon:yes stop_codon:yes gene_type:complete
MQKLRFSIFILTIFYLLSHLVIISEPRADEIEMLERKIEYLKAKKDLDLQLEIIKAKLKELDENYSDILLSVKLENKTEQEKKKNESSKSGVVEKRDWIVKGINAGRCQGWRVEKFHLNEDGAFKLLAKNPRGAWTGDYEGNFLSQEATVKASGGERVGSFEATDKGGIWHVVFNMAWSGGGCEIKFRVE